MFRRTAARLLIVGDSITLGVAQLRGEQIDAYVDRCYLDILREKLPGLDIRMDAETHRTTTEALRLIDGLLRQHQPTMVLLMLGGNDVDVQWKRFVISQGRIVRSRVSLEHYTNNLQALVRKVLDFGATPILTDMPNHCLALRGPYLSKLSGKNVTAMIAAHGGQPVSDAGLVEYRLAAERIARAVDCPFVSYGTALSRQPPLTVSSLDGVHPNSQAHIIIAAELAPVLSCLVGSSRSTLSRSSA